MKKPVTALFKGAGLWAKENSPHILVALGIGGMLTSVITAVKATPKAKALIDEATEEKGETLTAGEKFKAAWKCYILSAGVFLTSAGCIIGADVKNTKINAGLASSAALAETVLQTYQKNMVETIGEQEEQKVREKTKQELAENPAAPKDAVYILGGEKVLCADVCGNEWYATVEDVRAAVNRVNDRLNNDDYICLNEFYQEANAPDTVLGEYIGWYREKGLLSVHFTSDLRDGKPRLIVNYSRFDWFDYKRR